MKHLRVLVGMESSGIIRDAFLAAGFDAMSCDLLDTQRPGPHYKGDVRDLLIDGFWNLGIFHPSCQYLCSSGLHWNKRTPGRSAKTEEALEMVRTLRACRMNHRAIENPTGCIGTRIAPASQFVQPYDFGHHASKKTGLWLDNLPLLTPTKRINGRMIMYKGKMVERWANQSDSGQNNLPETNDRWQKRSETYSGIADAMVTQWKAIIR